MLDIKLGSKQINNLHILYENVKKYNGRFHGFNLFTFNSSNYDDFENKVIDLMNSHIDDSGDYENALSYFGIYPDEYDQNLIVASDIVDIYGDELKHRPLVEVGSGNFPALSRKIAQIYPQVSNIMVYDSELVVNKKIDTSHIEELNTMNIIREDYDSSKTIPRNSIIISRHPCNGTPAMIAGRTLNKHNNIDLYAVLCGCSVDRMNWDEYDWDGNLIKRDVRSMYELGSLDRNLAFTLFDENLCDKNGNLISWQDNLEEIFKNDPDYHFKQSIDPLAGSKYKVMYTMKR